jgi:hypothetical protein
MRERATGLAALLADGLNSDNRERGKHADTHHDEMEMNSSKETDT